MRLCLHLLMLLQLAAVTVFTKTPRLCSCLQHNDMVPYISYAFVTADQRGTTQNVIHAYLSGCCCYCHRSCERHPGNSWARMLPPASHICNLTDHSNLLSKQTVIHAATWYPPSSGVGKWLLLYCPHCAVGHLQAVVRYRATFCVRSST